MSTKITGYFVGLRGAGFGKKGLHLRDLDHLGAAGLPHVAGGLGGFRVLSASGSRITVAGPLHGFGSVAW